MRWGLQRRGCKVEVGVAKKGLQSWGVGRNVRVAELGWGLQRKGCRVGVEVAKPGLQKTSDSVIPFCICNHHAHFATPALQPPPQLCNPYFATPTLTLQPLLCNPHPNSATPSLQPPPQLCNPSFATPTRTLQPQLCHPFHQNFWYLASNTQQAKLFQG